jgi:hypothetical protein
MYRIHRRSQVSVFSRTLLANRLGIGGVVTLFIVAFALIGVGTVASAEPADQAATATATPTAATAATAVPCVNTGRGVQIVLGNPQPGDTLLTGVALNMAGIAFEPASTSGSGIASVTVYLGDRDAGGMSLGTALLGQPNPQAPAGSQFATAGFTLRTPSIPTGSGGRTIFVYARSAVTNLEAVLEVPIFLNTAPTPVKGQIPTAVLPPPPACTPTPVPTPIPTATALVVAPVVAATAAPFSPPTSVPTLALAAPAAAAPPVAAPNPPAPAVAAPAPAAAAAAATAPRGGGIPTELGLAILAAGALVLGGGMALRRRQRRTAADEGDSLSEV